MVGCITLNTLSGLGLQQQARASDQYSTAKQVSQAKAKTEEQLVHLFAEQGTSRPKKEQVAKHIREKKKEMALASVFQFQGG